MFSLSAAQAAVSGSSGATACAVAITVTDQWQGGFTANVTVTNSGTVETSSWSVGWTWPNSGTTISTSWNTVVTQTGNSVTATNESYNGQIAPGQSTSFGFQATSTGNIAAPTSFTLNGTPCGSSSSSTTTTTAIATTSTTAASSGTSTSSSGTSSGTSANSGATQSSTYTGNATYFSGLGSPYGGCGLPQANLDSQNFLALNVQNTPGNYSTFLPRPIPAVDAAEIGMFNNGLNCDRWVHVTIGDYCTGTNDGAPNEPFCRNGSWVADQYNGATLNFIVADSCQDANAWCRDDPYHVDLAENSLNKFILNGSPVGTLSSKWNNRQVHWYFESAPNYTGDINIGFIQGAGTYWSAIAINHLQNGIHGVEYMSGGQWQSATMDADMGDDYIIQPTTPGGVAYEIKV